RQFIRLVGGVVATWPFATHAQQADHARLIGVLTGTDINSETKRRMAAFLGELQRLGWSDGGNVRIALRASAGDVVASRRIAAELVALKPDVILAMGSQSVASLQEVTRTVPIVFTVVADPVGAGFVDSLARPGGNTTGFMLFEYT